MLNTMIIFLFLNICVCTHRKEDNFPMHITYNDAWGPNIFHIWNQIPYHNMYYIISSTYHIITCIISLTYHIKDISFHKHFTHIKYMICVEPWGTCHHTEHKLLTMLIMRLPTWLALADVLPKFNYLSSPLRLFQVSLALL